MLDAAVIFVLSQLIDAVSVPPMLAAIEALLHDGVDAAKRW
jgi:hypothetical protein